MQIIIIIIITTIKVILITIIIIFSKRTYLYTSYIQFDIVVRSCSVAEPCIDVNVLFIIYTANVNKFLAAPSK